MSERTYNVLSTAAYVVVALGGLIAIIGMALA